MSYSAEVLADAPRVYLPLSSDATDGSGNGRNGTITGSLSFAGAGPSTGTTAASGWSSSNYITLPSAAYASGPFTFEAWVKTSSVGWAFFLGLNTDQGLVGIDGSTHNLTYVAGTGNNKQGSNIADGAWHHVVVTRDGSSNLVIYVDGSSVGTASGVGAPTATTIHVGTDAAAGSPWGGPIARVAIYDTALSSTRVAAHYTAGTTLPDLGVGSGVSGASASGSAIAKGSGSASSVSSAIASGTPSSTADPNVSVVSGKSSAGASGQVGVRGQALASSVSRTTAIGGTRVSGVGVASGVASAIVSRYVQLSALPAEESDAPIAPAVYAPSGDRFNDPIVISGLNGEFPMTFLGATTESGESLPTGVTKTLWLSWEVDEDIDAPRVMMDTGFASIRVGTGDTLAGFIPLWSGEGGVAVYPVSGTKYMIQLGWHADDPDDVTLIWESENPPFYDFFETPFDLGGDWDRANLSTDFCSLETGESTPPGTYTTAWSRWQPDTAGDAVIEATDSDLVIQVFEDSVDLTSLTLVASGTGSVSFAADAVPYLIQICDLREPGT